MNEGLHITHLKEFDEINHYRSLNSPLLWETNALSLRTSAEVLYKYEVSNMEGDNKVYKVIRPIKNQCLMLFAQMLENYLKCILAHKGLLERKFMKGHDLLELSKRAGINLDREQSLFLSYMSNYIVWRGRYPYPKKIEEYGVSLEDEYLPIHTYEFSEDVRRAIFLGDRFEDCIADFWGEKISLSKQNVLVKEGKNPPYSINPYPFIREKTWVQRAYKVVIGSV